MTRGRQILVGFAIAAVTFAVYLKTAGFGLINIDDYEYLVGENGVTGGVSIANISWALGSVEHAIWMPLTFFSYMLDASLFGYGNWGAMHIHSAALHAINAVLLFVLFHTLLGYAQSTPIKRVTISIAATLLWSLHPLRVESVAWLASRKDVLSFTFELLAMLCWVKSSGSERLTPTAVCAYALSLVCFILSAMAKPSVMTFPILMLLVDAFLIRRIRLWMYIPAVVIMVAIGLEASAIQAIGGATGDFAGSSLFYRILNAMNAFGIYVTNTFWPAHLGPQCMNRFPALPKALATGIAISLSTGVWLLLRLFPMWRERTRLFIKEDINGDQFWRYTGDKDILLAGILWFVVGIGPFLGIANFGYHAFADRFTYIPAVGLSLIAVSLMLKVRYSLPLALVGIPLATYAVWRQVDAWRDDKAVWNATIAADGEENAVAHSGLGMYEFEFNHDLEEACREFNIVKTLNPHAYLSCVQIHVFALAELGREPEAYEALQWYRQRMSEYKANYKRQNKAEFERTGVIPGLGNLHYAEIAYAICYEPKRVWAEKELMRLSQSMKMSKVLAYLIHCYAKTTGNEALAESALKDLKDADTIDYFQFRCFSKSQGDQR